MSPLKLSPSFSRTATGASKSPAKTSHAADYETYASHAAKRQEESTYFAEARASPTPQQAERIKGLEGALQNARGFINRAGAAHPIAL